MADQSTDNPRPAARRQALLLCGLALPLLIGLYALVLGYWARPQSSGRQLRLDEFLGLVAKGQVGSATILASDDRVTGTYGGGQRYWVDFAGGHETLFARITGALEQAKVPTQVQSQPLKGLVTPVSTLLPVLILGDLIVLVTLLTRGGGTPLGSFGRAGSRRVDDSPITFADLAGVDEAVEELAEICAYLADPSRFSTMGAAVPKGVLLSGPPGCGKTRLARAVAGESAVPFFSISGSDFVEMFVGVGAARIRDLFAQAKATAPAVIFIDEIDAVGRSRTVVATGGSDEREATLNQLLVEMDGFDSDAGVVVLAATNRPDILDSALLRPGRFDRRVAIAPPDRSGREAILGLHAASKPLAADVDLGALAALTAGFSGADLANVVNEAALLATRHRSTAIEAAHLSEAVERVVAGPQRRSRLLTPADRRRIAVHEAGHAVAASSLPGAAPVTKVSVLARGATGGVTLQVSEADRVLATRSELVGRIVTLLGGRVAEELVFGEPSTGANDDLAKAAALARAMVWECGMSLTVGPLAFANGGAGDGGSTPPISERLAADLDAAAQAILADAECRAEAVLTANRGLLIEVADALADAETLEGDDLASFLVRVQAPPVSAPAQVAVVRELWREPSSVDDATEALAFTVTP